MSEFGFAAVEQGMRIARDRSAYLAADAANATSPRFEPLDLTVVPGDPSTAVPFSAALKRVGGAGAASIIDYTMAATAKNAVAYRALAEQERAMLREFRTVAEESRR